MTNSPSGKLYSSEREQTASLHGNMSFTDKRVHEFIYIRTLAKARGAVTFGGVVVGRGPRKVSRTVVLCLHLGTGYKDLFDLCRFTKAYT